MEHNEGAQSTESMCEVRCARARGCSDVAGVGGGAQGMGEGMYSSRVHVWGVQEAAGCAADDEAGEW
jgi:hypothetical protein